MSGLDVTTPWYPAPHKPVNGSFVASWTSLAVPLTGPAHVYHASEWPGGKPDVVARWRDDFDEVVGRLGRSGRLDVTSAVGTLTRLPVLVTGGATVAQRCLDAADAVARYVGPLSAPVVHAHVGYLGGLMAVRNAAPGARIIVTEHSTGLEDFLSTAEGRAIYDEVLAGCHRLTTVSSPVRDLVLRHFPERADRVVVVPNPVDFEPAEQRTEPPTALDSWVYAGGLIPRKGVVRMVKAFCAFAQDRPAATLDLFGDGPQRDELAELCADAGLTDRVTFHGMVPHEELLAALPRFDLLVALSTYETFHLVVPEAIAALVPVVVSRSVGPEEAVGDAADLVGIFVDVNEDPDEVVDAVRTLEARLPALDLVAGRARLAARYGHEAVTRRLGELYGPTEPTPAASTPRAGRPRDVTVLANRGWRGYAIDTETAVARTAGLPIRVVSDDVKVADLAGVTERMRSADFMRALGTEPVTQPVGPRTQVKRLAKWVLRRVRGRPVPAVVKPVSRADVAPPGRAFLLADASSAPEARALLDAVPEAAVLIEFDRVGLGLPPVDRP